MPRVLKTVQWDHRQDDGGIIPVEFKTVKPMNLKKWACRKKHHGPSPRVFRWWIGGFTGSEGSEVTEKISESSQHDVP